VWWSCGSSDESFVVQVLGERIERPCERVVADGGSLDDAVGGGVVDPSQRRPAAIRRSSSRRSTPRAAAPRTRRRSTAQSASSIQPR
jgi:hypothetical protein